MELFTYHLVKTDLASVVRSIAQQPNSATTPGLVHSECMTVMQLGAPVISPLRYKVGKLAVFAAWKNETAIDTFMASQPLGKELAKGWHVRMEFTRRWGKIAELDDLPQSVGEQDPSSPAIAVTLARLKHTQIPRFIKWGKPVEEQVRDAPGATLALAAMHPMRTVSTFSIWETQEAMTNMVRGHSSMPQPRRHADAMIERTRKDFHFEFTTLRFRALSEHGKWNGRTNIVPGLSQKSD